MPQRIINRRRLMGHLGALVTTWHTTLVRAQPATDSAALCSALKEIGEWRVRAEYGPTPSEGGKVDFDIWHYETRLKLSGVVTRANVICELSIPVMSADVQNSEVGEIVLTAGAFREAFRGHVYDSMMGWVLSAELTGPDMYRAYGVLTRSDSVLLEVPGDARRLAPPKRISTIDTKQAFATLFETVSAQELVLREGGDCESGYSDSDLGLEDCYLTTACCKVMGRPDDGWELATLRRFRDGWLSRQAFGPAVIADYYACAPIVLSRLKQGRAMRSKLRRLYWLVIIPCAVAIRLGANRLAYRMYRRMVIRMAES